MCDFYTARCFGMTVDLSGWRESFIEISAAVTPENFILKHDAYSYRVSVSFLF